MKARLGLMYFAMFAFCGIHMPYWPVWLSSKGLTDSQIAILTALGFSLKIVSTPVVASAVDGNGRRRDALVALALGLFAFCTLFFKVSGFLSIFFVTTAAFACWSPMMSLCESLTTITAKKHGLDYGKIRLWGSVAFMLVAIGSGKLLQVAGERVLLWAIVSTSGLVFAASLLLPRNPVVSKKNGAGTPAPFLKSRWFVTFILATTLIQGSHAAYYTFGTIHWQSEGMSDGVIGMFWGGSMAVEVCFFAFGRSFLNRLGPINVIMLGGIAAAVRWTIIGSTGSVALIALAQALHALSFGASHFAAMRLIAENVDDSLSATGQGIYSAFIMGIGMGIFVLLSGPLYSALHGATFFVMAAVSLTGVAVMWASKSTALVRIVGTRDAAEVETTAAAGVAT